ncbi:MAG: DinB family protein [Ferruginibacter sp.]
MRQIIAIAALVCVATTFTNKANAQALTTEDIKSLMVKEWERAKAYTIEYMNTMPANKYGFKAQDSIRSFAQQLLHLAGGNVFLMNTATGDATPAWSGRDLEQRPGAQSKDSVVFYVNASYDYCINAVKNADLAKWGEKVKVFGMEQTRYAMMIKTFEHQTHHRGQTTIYIRLQGIKPPQEKLF